MSSHLCFSDIGEATLKIVGVTTEDDGIYTCIAVNDMGSASSSASLRVLGKPPGAGHLCQRSPEVQCIRHTWCGMKFRTEGHVSKCPEEAQTAVSVTRKVSFGTLKEFRARLSSEGVYKGL